MSRRNREKRTARSEEQYRESSTVGVKVKTVKGLGELVRGNAVLFLVFAGALMVTQSFIPTVLPSMADKLYFTFFGSATLGAGFILWRKWR